MSPRDFYRNEWRAGYIRGRKARQSGRFQSWVQCADEITWHALYGFIAGFRGEPDG